ncbi:hypothetical protein [Variovorax sp. GrIS 2.14]|uniref:hypothetical protein n=1 Tax=Variovorax sp. GrIS 2.14 TaxID=3071709 RepID=UPI0038F6494C
MREEADACLCHAAHRQQAAYGANQQDEHRSQQRSHRPAGRAPTALPAQVSAMSMADDRPEHDVTRAMK